MFVYSIVQIIIVCFTTGKGGRAKTLSDADDDTVSTLVPVHKSDDEKRLLDDTNANAA